MPLIIFLAWNYISLGTENQGDSEGNLYAKALLPEIAGRLLGIQRKQLSESHETAISGMVRQEVHSID